MSMSGKSLKVLFICLLVLYAASPLAADDKKKGKGGRPALVEVAQARHMFLSPTVWVSGTVISREQAGVPAEVSGKLTWVAEVGTRVKAGALLAKLDDTLFQLQVSEQEAAYNKEKIRLKFLESELKRLEELTRQEFAAASQLEKLQADRDVGLSELSVGKAKLKLARETLSRYEVRAPFDGVVVSRKLRSGEWVKNGDTVVELSNPQSLEIVLNVSDKSVGFLSVGETLSIAADPQPVPARVRAIVPVGDSTSLLYDVRLQADSASWRAGQSVRVMVPTGSKREVLAVPRDALVLRRTGNSVYIVNAENKAQKTGVETGIASGLWIEVKGKLAAGDQVVIRGGERLRPMQDVKILKERYQQ